MTKEEMPTVIQSFDLVEDKLNGFFISNIISRLHMMPSANTVEATTSLVSGLVKKGYLVYHSGCQINYVPDKILVIGKIGMDIKGDFYALSMKSGLPFKSGEAYFDYIQRNRHEIIPTTQSNMPSTLEELAQTQH